MKYSEINFDGLVGPSHFYGGLSFGNQASMLHKHRTSNPKLAALESLNKMVYISELGITQGFFPPHERPNLQLLRDLGFSGKDPEVISKVAKQAPDLLQAAYSSAFMWTANAAWVSSSLDTRDNKVHITPANLISNLHRAQEALQTSKVLKVIFNSSEYFVHHSPLAASLNLADEGSANFNRIALNSNQAGISVFTYGKNNYNFNQSKKFPARQTKLAVESIARLHMLDPAKVVYLKQNPIAIDAGVFHNDVVATSASNVFLFHEEAYDSLDEKIKSIKKLELDNKICFIKVPSSLVSLKDAVDSYLFNCQLLELETNSKLLLLLPEEVKHNPKTYSYVQNLVSANNSISEIDFINLQQSMANGGGPACLRLKMLLNIDEQNSILKSVIINAESIKFLKKWINKHYRDSLTLKDLADPQLLIENQTALDELSRMIGISNLYSFQY